MASGEEKLTLQFSLSGELKNLVANMSTGTENMAKSSVKRFSVLLPLVRFHPLWAFIVEVYGVAKVDRTCEFRV